MNKKGQAAWETGRWMIKNIVYVFVFVICAGFIFAIVTSFIHMNVEADDAIAFSTVNALGECLKKDGIFSLEKSSKCTKFNENFMVELELNGKKQEASPQYYASKGLCTFKNYVCGKDILIDREGNSLGIGWVIVKWTEKDY